MLCEASRFSSIACLLRHEREAHAMHGLGDKPYLCIYDGCDRGLAGNGFPRHWNLRDHMRRVHNDPGPTKCSTGGSSPPYNGTVRGGNKRKAEVSEATAVEKPLKRIATPPVLVRQPLEPSLVDCYFSSEQRLLETVKQLHDPTNSSNMTLLRNASNCIKVMAQTTQRINSAPAIYASNLLYLDPNLDQASAVQLHHNKHDDRIEVPVLHVSPAAVTVPSTDPTGEEQAKSKITATLSTPTAPKVSSVRPEVSTLRFDLSNNVPSDLPDGQDQLNYVIESPGSAGTASTFNATDSSSLGEDECLLTRSEQKQVLLDRLMRYFYSIFSASPSPGPYVREHGAGNSTSTCQTSGDHRHSYQSQSPTHYSNSTSSIFDKRQTEGDDGDGCARKRPRLELNDPADDQSKRLACPFFKKDPRQYQGGSRSCSGPGWLTVHRIKYIDLSHILCFQVYILTIIGSIFIGAMHYQSAARGAMRFFRRTDSKMNTFKPLNDANSGTLFGLSRASIPPRKSVSGVGRKRTSIRLRLRNGMIYTLFSFQILTLPVSQVPVGFLPYYGMQERNII
jgi:hypothetical protein